MDRFFSHLKQPFTSVWISLGFVIGCMATVFYYQTLEFSIFTISVLIVSAYFKPFLNVLLGFICAICCVGLHFYFFYDIDALISNEKYTHATKIIVEDVISNKQPQYIKAKIIELDDQRYSYFRAPNALLSVNSDQMLLIGDTFEAHTHLKTFRSTKNFNVFDNERYAFTQKIFFKGKILNKELHITDQQHKSSVFTYRQFVQGVYKNTQLHWLYYALLTGDKSLMDSSDKKLMQTLGLSHLLAISGLHIALVFGFGYVATRFLFKRIGVVGKQTKNLSVIYSSIGFICAFIYVYLSDYLVSATRALVMLGCYLLLYFLAKQPLRWRSILFALVIVLLINPFSVLNPGLYFSFLAVVVIFLVINKVPILSKPLLNKVMALIVIQFALFVGLMPLSVYFFNGVSLVGIVLNLIAIPLLSFVIMPVLIFVTLLSSVLDMSFLILLLDSALGSLFNLLTLVPDSVRWVSVGGVDSKLVLFWYLTILILYFSPFKWMAFIPLSSFLINYLMIDKAQWKIHFFDVGHGLMVLLEKDKHALIYDFGPSYFNRFSRARSILLPYIDTNKLIVSASILSHEDNDHAGGVDHFIKAGYESSFKEFHPENLHDVCKVTITDFYGLRVESFKTTHFNNENDDSCVIRVSDSNHSALLTGDISKQREKQLLNAGYVLKSTVMVSPHHGSNTSSSKAFIDKVSPQVVIHSSAYQNQWGFPKDEVVTRYNAIKAAQYTTALQGQISIEFYEDEIKVITAREQESYWFIKD